MIYSLPERIRTPVRQGRNLLPHPLGYREKDFNYVTSLLKTTYDTHLHRQYNRQQMFLNNTAYHFPGRHA